MADASIIQPSFASGEVSPDLYGRVDLAKFHVGAATMRNFFVNYKGGASTRPGTQFIANTGTGPIRLRRFVFSATQTYILVFGTNTLQFIKNPMTPAYPNSSNSGFILSGGTPYQITTPYGAADLPFLKFSQSADIMNITCANNAHPRMILSRLSDTNWTLTTPTTGSSVAAPPGPALSITGPPSGSTDPLQTTYLYAVTAVGTDGEESNIDGFGYVHGLDMASTLGSVTVTWPSVAGASYYNVYRAISTSGNAVPSLGQQLGFLGFSYGPSFVDSNIVPDFTRSPPTHSDPFSPAQITGYTITSGGSGYDIGATTITGAPGGAILAPIFDNHTVGGTGSIVGLYSVNPGENVPAGTTLGATGPSGSGFSATVTVSPSNQNPAVSAYFQQRLMLASTPNNPVTLWGSRNGYYNNFDKSNPIVDSDALEFTLAVQQVNAIEWMVTMPGGLVLFTDAGVQQLTGGSTNATNPMAVTPSSAVVVPQSYYGANNTCEPIVINYDILYVQSEGSVVRDLQYNFFVNIYTGTDITLLSSHLFYPHQIIDWSYQDVPFKCVWIVRDDGVLLSLTYLKEQEITGFARHDSQGGVFESVAVIREGAMDAVYFAINRGGNRFIERLCDRQYQGGVSTAWCLDAALSYSGSPVTVVSGLDHLNGRAVMALADGVPQGPFTVSGGAITLPVAASNVVAGLGIQAQLQTLYLDVGEGGGSIQGKRKKIAAMSTRVKETAGLKIGTTFNTLTPFRPGISSTDPTAWPAPPGLITGDMRLVMDPMYQVSGSVCIQQDDPLPATVLAVIPEISIGDGQR
jgi:hypothetical protein